MKGSPSVALLFLRHFMENSLYSNLGQRKNRTFQEQRPEDNLTLKDFIEHKFTLHNKEELKRTFARELRDLLKKDNLFDLITAFFELETDLAAAVDSVDFETNLNFDEFYKNLSPVLMRSILENANRPDNAQLILKSIKESLRIAIEEELYQLDDLKF